MTTQSAADLRISDPRMITGAVVGLVGAAAIGVACLWSPEGSQSGPELCAFRRLTGLPCPGCGLTRSWVSFMHGDFRDAVAFNAFGPVFLLVTAATVLGIGWFLIRRRPPTLSRLRGTIATPLAITLVVAWLGYGIFRTVDAGMDWGILPAVA